MSAYGNKYIKLPLSFREHGKVEELSDLAYRQLVTAFLYAGAYETDGFLTETQVKKQFAAKVLKELVAAPFIYKLDDGRYRLHEWPEHQMTAAQMAETRERAKAAGAAGGKAKAANRAANPQANAPAEPSDELAETYRPASETPSKPLADGYQPASDSASNELDGKLAAGLADGLAESWRTSSSGSSESPSETLPSLALALDLEGNTKAKSVKHSCSPQASSGIEFADFYALYPRKLKRPDAERAWTKALRTTAPEVIMAGLRQWLAHEFCPQGQFMPYPASWLNAEQWNDEPTRHINPRSAEPRRNRAAERTADSQATIARLDTAAAFRQTSYTPELGAFR